MTRSSASCHSCSHSPELVARTEALGFEVLASSPETALQELRAYSMKWAQLVKERNIKVE